VGPKLIAPAERWARSRRAPGQRLTAWRRLGACGVGLAGLVLLSGCSQATTDQWKRLGLPEEASTSASSIGSLWIGSWIAAFAVGFLVWGLIIWAVIRYRRRAHDEIPTQVRYNLPLEVLYTVAPFVIIFVLFYHTVVTQEEVLPDDRQAPEEIQVVGQQWSWSFNYLRGDGHDEPGTGPVNDVYTVGTVADRPTLYLPVDTQVKFTFRSQDVIHSFWIPAFYFKIDVVPGRSNTWVTTATKMGTYAGKCAELCGLEHSRMLFDVKVVSKAEYERQLQALRAQGNVGSVLGSTEPDRVAGLEHEHENGAGQ
jgi:cytochrome c oxidase subunit II